MLALMTAGCSGSKVSTVATPSVSPEVKPPVVQPKVPSNVAGQNDAIAVAPGLIQATNPNERAKQVVKGKPDPFALLPGQAVPVVFNVPTFQRSINRPPQNFPTLPPLQPITLRPSIPAVLRLPALTPIPPKSIGNPSNPLVNNPLPPSSPIVTAPPLPQADLAKSVAVTGVVQVGDEIEAIVKVPDEATSRYVKVGQRLSNGQVLVKRIEMNQGSNPVVILEQYGIEVARAVGEQPVNPAPAKPTAVLPNNQYKGTKEVSAMSQPATTLPSTPPLATNQSSAGENTTLPSTPPLVTNQSSAGENTEQ